MIGNGRLDFYAGAVLHVGSDTDVPNANEPVVANEDYEEAANDYEPLIALLCIFDDKPRHDFDDASLTRLVRLNEMLTSQLLKITADHITMRRLRLQQGESGGCKVGQGSIELIVLHHLSQLAFLPEFISTFYLAWNGGLICPNSVGSDERIDYATP